MRTGICPKCGSTNVFSCKKPNQGGGVHYSSEHPFCLRLRNTYSWRNVENWETCLCSDCGYFENYILDKDSIELVVSSADSIWEKIIK